MKAWKEVALSGALVVGLAGAMSGPAGWLIGGVAALFFVLFVAGGEPIEQAAREASTPLESVATKGGAVVYVVLFLVLFTLGMGAVAMIGAGL